MSRFHIRPHPYRGCHGFTFDPLLIEEVTDPPLYLSIYTIHMIHFHRLLESSLGKIIVSILLGLGLASVFRKACTDKSCIQFKGPVLSEIDGKIQQYGDQCYKYDMVHASCDANKKKVLVEKPE